MYVKIKNENYGYAVSTYGDYVVVANPAITSFTIETSSLFYTGSVDYFRYNKSTDEHDYVATFYNKPIEMDVLLARELNRQGLNTEDTGSVLRTNDKGLCIDKDLYTKSISDGFGLSLDMYNKYLIVGNPFYNQIVQTEATTFSSGGSSVSIFDLGLTEYVTFNSSASVYDIEGPNVVLPTGISGSFGMAVSINKDWIAVGSPYVSSSNGMVYMYKNISTGINNYSWSLFQKLEASGAITGAQFGSSLKLNKYSGSHSSSIVIGCGNPINAKAYYFEYISESWKQAFIFRPDYTIAPMTFANYLPYQPTMNMTNGFGTSVSMYGDAVIVGEYLDRSFNEYSGSTRYEQGSVYIFERCAPSIYNVPPNVLFQQVLKTYGTPLTLKNNRAGFSVDMFGNNAVAGIPKTNIFDLTSCTIGGTIPQLHYCNSELETTLLGQAMLLQKNTSSGDWEITNIYQRKKKFLSPYKSFGFDVAIADRSMVIGAPMYLQDSNRQINIDFTQSLDIILDDVAGKSYIYNLSNLRDTFHVGNVFYRNGKIILMTSGSIFDGLLYNPINTNTYEYDLQFKGQHTIFEKQIVCTVNSGEFNVSTNPTAIILSQPLLDINKNSKFDFQDVDVILSYMQYKNTSLLGVPVSTDWRSSVVTTDDEISLLNYYQTTYNNVGIDTLISESIIKWETTNINMQTILDLNEDNRIDIRDMNIMWKYFANRLNQENYASYITPACHRKLFNDIMDYMETLSRKNSNPKINTQFLDYENSVAFDNTGSFLAPMVTTIGLYSGLDLVGVSKLGTPLRITPELPISFIIKMDY